jgi:radical SAM superfamily enzyme YgiQ (UPF0313 family)
MILLVNPRATKPGFRRFPLSLMALGAALPEGESWEIFDGNEPGNDKPDVLFARIDAAKVAGDPVELLAITAMPGPQMRSAIPLTKALRARDPKTPIVWGGYFPTMYTRVCVEDGAIDWIVRGRRDPATVLGLAWRGADGEVHVNGERPWVGPSELPDPRYDKIHVPGYLESTFLGRRTGVYQASIGCPYVCNFCAVIDFFGSREKFEEPARVARHLSHLVKTYGMDGLHFYDNNFFLKEDHAVEMAERLTPLGLRWWCEARVDVMLKFSDATWTKLARSGLAMVFYGAESGSDEALRRMKKHLTVAETLELARRIRPFGIRPEFSFVIGGPDDPQDDVDRTLRLVRELKAINPASEIILQYYTPTPQRKGTYGDVDPYEGTPATLDEWATPAWVDWSTHEKPLTRWVSAELGATVADFELVLKSRFPSVQDAKTREWGKRLGKALARRRWDTGNFANPRLLRKVRTLAKVPLEERQMYGHLRPPDDPRTP